MPRLTAALAVTAAVLAPTPALAAPGPGPGLNEAVYARQVEQWYAVAHWHEVVAWNEWNEAVANAQRAPRGEPVAARPPKRPGGSNQGMSWDSVAHCESEGNWASRTGRYEGGLQFDPDTWRAYSGTDYADHAYQATRDQQIAVAERVLAGQGWSAWPVCGPS